MGGRRVGGREAPPAWFHAEFTEPVSRDGSVEGNTNKEGVMPSRWRRALSSVLVVSYTSACSSWQVAGPSPEEYMRAHSPEELRVTRMDSSTIVLRAPRLQVDSLVGTAGGGLRRDDSLRIVTIPLSEVRMAEVRESNTVMTLGIVGLVMLVVGVAFEASGGIMGD